MYKKILLAFMVWKGLLLLFAYGGSVYVPLENGGLARTIAFGTPYMNWIWANFDGVRYLTIASFGYQYPNFAFFPLLPWIISLVNTVTPLTHLDAGLIIVNISIVAALIFIYKIIALDYSERIAFRAVILLLVFPFSYYYQSVYTDAPFLFLSTASFYFARRSRWLAAGVFGYVAGLTRLVGVVLLPVLLIEWYLQQKKKKRVVLYLPAFLKQKAFFILLIPLGIITYGSYLQISHDNFFLFQKSMADWGQDKIVFPLQVVYRYMKIFSTASFGFLYLVALIEFTATLLYFTLSVYVLRRIRLSYGVFMLLLLLIPTFTGTFQSMPRYLLHLFPAFLGLAVLTQKSRLLFYSMLLLCLILQGIFVALFTRGHFVA